MSKWFEADNGFLVNLDLVKAVQDNGDSTSTIHFGLGSLLESVTCAMPYISLKSLLVYRSEKEPESTKYLRTIASGSFTPVP